MTASVNTVSAKQITFSFKGIRHAATKEIADRAFTTMFFFTDESGNTGNNLFDDSQPTLSYGVLSSVTNPDVLSASIHNKMLRKLGVSQLHANELGEQGLASIGELLYLNQKKLKFDFDFYFVEKLDYALVVFFDRVFDSVLNVAVPWHWYNTPIRYMVIIELASLFNEDLLKLAWSAAISLNADEALGDLITTLKEVSKRANSHVKDARAREVIVEALDWGAAHPEDLHYTISNKHMRLYASPNVVGFQFVLASVARRTSAKRLRQPRSIIVDRQTQFNKTQKDLQKHYAAISKEVKTNPYPSRAFLDRDLNKEFSNMPIDEFRVLPSSESIGLQITDIYLWLFNRLLKHGDIHDDLKPVLGQLMRRSTTDGISIDGIATRLQRFDADLPAMEATDKVAAKKLLDEFESRRVDALANHGSPES